MRRITKGMTTVEWATFRMDQLDLLMSEAYLSPRKAAASVVDMDEDTTNEVLMVALQRLTNSKATA